MLRGFDPAEQRDIVFVPVGINYDRVLEDRTLLRDLDPEAERVGGGKAARTTLGFVLHNLRLALFNHWHRFGYACVNFGTPVSAKAWLAERGVDLRKLSKEERFAEIQRLADDLMAAVGRAVPAVPVALVGDGVRAAGGGRRRDGDLESDAQRLEIKARVYELMRGAPDRRRPRLHPAPRPGLRHRRRPAHAHPAPPGRRTRRALHAPARGAAGPALLRQLDRAPAAGGRRGTRAKRFAVPAQRSARAGSRTACTCPKQLGCGREEPAVSASPTLNRRRGRPPSWSSTAIAVFARAPCCGWSGGWCSRWTPSLGSTPILRPSG